MSSELQNMATSPLGFTRRDWWLILKDMVHETNHDNVAIIAAGVAFFTMLAVFPLITACISIYGYVADPVRVQMQLQNISGLFPAEAWDILNAQVMAVASAPDAQLGLGIAIGLLIALWSAGAGIRAIMRAMNVAYDEKEKRSIAAFYALAGMFTLSVTVFLWVALAVIIGVPALLTYAKLDGLAAAFTQYLPWIILLSLFGFAVAVLYQYGPSRRPAKLRWIIPGCVLATMSWIFISMGFSWFVSAFGTYNKTYGSLSAVIMLLMWFWITALVIIIGAELNAAMERHTGADTTRGPDRPIGMRGAAVANHSHY
ncbi:MAG: YihY/virulence factor BrkB family protein [Alphaproteobacteria bacterium]